MPLYTIQATRETYYELEIEADNEDAAREEVSRIELEEDIESYAYDWFPLEITDVEENEEDN